MKYIVTRMQRGKVTLTRDGKRIFPGESQKLRNHSPDGFEFGYGGSGPAQLALAILLDYSKDPGLAQKHYQDFKFEFIAHATGSFIEINGEEIEQWLKKRQ